MSKRKTVMKRKPIGKPLPVANDSDAEITPQDIEQAKMFVKKYGSPRFVAMLEAKPDDGDDFA